MVIGGDSCSERRGFKSQHCILDGHFSHISVVKIAMFVLKDWNKRKRGQGWPIFIKTWNYLTLFYFSFAPARMIAVWFSLLSSTYLILNIILAFLIFTIKLIRCSNNDEVVVAQLVERSLPIPEICGSKSVIDKNLYLFWTFVYCQLCIEKMKIKKKRPGMAHFKKTMMKWNGATLINYVRILAASV